MFIAAPLSSSAPGAGNDPEYIMTRYQTEDGLPESSATSIVQTADGFLWIGTFNGLVRFDGRRMVVFDTSNTPQLPHDGIVSLYLDRTGAIWVSTLGGLARMSGGVWRRFGQDAGWRGNHVRHFLEAPDGSLYFSTFDGITLHFRDGRLTELKSLPAAWLPREFRDTGSTFLFFDAQGQLMAGRGPVLGTFAGGDWKRLPVPDEIARNVRPEAAAWGVGENGMMFVAGKDTLFAFNARGVLRRTPLKLNEDVWALTPYQDGTVWISTYRNGLIRVGSGGSVRTFHKQNGFVTNSFRFGFKDREGNIWAGTNGSGLIRLKPRRFLGWSEADGLPAVRTSSVIRTPSGDRLIGTYGGGLYRMRGREIRPEPFPGRGAFIQSLLYSRDVLWIGKFHGIETFGSGRPLTYPDELATTSIHALFEDSRRRIWIGADKAAAVYDRGTFTVLDARAGQGPLLASYFAEDASGQIWVAGDGGLYRVEGSTLVSVPDEAGQRLPPLRSIRILRSGELWLGSKARGLLYWKGGAVSEIGTAKGLSARNIGEIIEEAGYLWLATNQGVWRASVRVGSGSRRQRRSDWLANVRYRRRNAEPGMFLLVAAIGHERQRRQDLVYDTQRPCRDQRPKPPTNAPRHARDYPGCCLSRSRAPGAPGAPHQCSLHSPPGGWPQRSGVVHSAPPFGAGEPPVSVRTEEKWPHRSLGQDRNGRDHVSPSGTGNLRTVVEGTQRQRRVEPISNGFDHRPRTGMDGGLRYPAGSRNNRPLHGRSSGLGGRP